MLFGGVNSSGMGKVGRNRGFLAFSNEKSVLFQMSNFSIAKFIYPPYDFKMVDKLITNFHQPQSTLMMLVSAFANKDFVMDAYSEAIKKKYKFYCIFHIVTI